MKTTKQIFKTIRLIKSIPFQILAVILYFDILLTPELVVKEGEPILAFLSFVFKVIIMIALSLAVQALSPKPKRPSPNHAKPVGLEQFDFPTAEEGRSIQVIFGKKYIAGPNVVWYGHLKTVAVWGF